MTNKTKWITLCLIMCLSLILLLSACTPKPIEKPNLPDDPLPQMPLRITWQDYSGRGVAIQKIIDVYNQREDRAFEIILQSGDENLDAIESLISGTTQMPVLVLPYRFVKYLGDEDQLVDLAKDFIDEKDLFHPELWKLGTIEEQVYGIPWVGHSVCLLYNKTLLSEAGVDPSKISSLAMLVDALKQVEEKTDAKGIGLVGANHKDISWMVNQFIYGFEGQLLDPSGKKVLINSDASREAITFYKDILGAYAQPSWLTDTGVEVMAHFRKQAVAFEFQGVWGLTDVEKNGNPFEVGIINLDSIGLKSEVGPLMLSVPKNMTQVQQNEAKKLIAYMISIEGQEAIMDGEYSPEHDSYYPFRVPVRIDLAERLIFKENPEYLPFISGFKYPSIDVPVPKWQVIKDLYYAPGLSQVMASEISIDDFLRNIEAEGNKLLNAPDND